MAKNTGLMIAIGVGAYYLLSNSSSGKLIYRDSMGNQITSIAPNHTMTFEVPGYTAVWLTELRNGVVTFDGPFNVPMPPYLVGTNDIGVYQVTAYSLDAYGNKGNLIGSTTFTIQ